MNLAGTELAWQTERTRQPERHRTARTHLTIRPLPTSTGYEKATF